MRHKGIRRVDCDTTRTHGWSATVKRKSGEVIRLFSDGRYGGNIAAYRAAISWIKKQWNRYPTVPRILRMTTVRRNNRTGTSGVYRWPADGQDVPGAYWGPSGYVSQKNHLGAKSSRYRDMENNQPNEWLSKHGNLPLVRSQIKEQLISLRVVLSGMPATS